MKVIEYKKDYTDKMCSHYLSHQKSTPSKISLLTKSANPSTPSNFFKENAMIGRSEFKKYTKSLKPLVCREVEMIFVVQNFLERGVQMRTPQRQNNSKLAKGLNLMRNKSSIVEKGNELQVQARREILSSIIYIL